MTLQPDWQTDDGSIRLYRADCLELLPQLEAGSVDCVVTSPPYAEQRAATYGGISERDYPAWLTKIAGACGQLLRDDGSLLVNIREHRTSKGMSDYVHRTRLHIRERTGLVEVDELVWIKPDAMPTAPNTLPRRGWERILWFSPTSLPFCNAQDTSRTLDSFNKTLNRYAVKIGAKPTGTERMPKHPRWLNYVHVPVGGDVSVQHPAKFPLKLAVWLTQLASQQDATILDPFMGSGTTGVACVKTGRKFIGVEIDPGYFDIAVNRIKKAIAEQKEMLPLEAAV
jgi:site-specific DNA-methyltransferase (adenine-specific)